MTIDSTDKRRDLINSPSLYNILYLQKMTFEQARLEKDYETMRSALQNILDNIIAKASKEGKKKQIAQIKKALAWIDNLQYDKKYTRKLSTGATVKVFPVNIGSRLNYAFVFAYSNINRLIDDLNIV